MKIKYWILILPLWIVGCGGGQTQALHEEVARGIMLYYAEYGVLPPLADHELVESLDRGNPKEIIFWTMPDGFRSPSGGIQNARGGLLRVELIDDRRIRITSDTGDSNEVVTVHAIPEPVAGGNAIYAPGEER